MLLTRIASAFQKARLPYALVGGYAVNLHGAVRGTVDIDLVIALKEPDFLKVEKVLKSLGLIPRLPVTAKEVFNFRKEYIEKRNLIAWSFYNPKDPSEVVDIIITQDVQKMKIKKFSLQGVPLMVASMEDLIKMKNKTSQIHSNESLNHGKKLTTEQIVQFLENFRKLSSKTSSQSKLISLKVPESLLEAFRLKAESQGLKYQTQIKTLMEEWVREIRKE